MNRSIEASGKTVKDAIQNGLTELGCTLDEVETSVIDMGSPGLFGMFGKPAKVRLTVKGEDHSFDIEMPVFTLDQPGQGGRKRGEKKRERAPKAESAPAAEAQSAAEPEAEAAQESAPAEQPREKRERKPRARKERKEQPREERPEPVTVAAPAEPAEPFVAMADEELSDTAKSARSFL